MYIYIYIYIYICIYIFIYIYTYIYGVKSEGRAGAPQSEHTRGGRHGIGRPIRISTYLHVSA